MPGIGVTEAMNESDEMFSNERLLQVLSGCREKSVSEIVSWVNDAIAGFCKHTPQYDDITMLAVRYNGKQ